MKVSILEKRRNICASISIHGAVVVTGARCLQCNEFDAFSDEVVPRRVDVSKFFSDLLVLADAL